MLKCSQGRTVAHAELFTTFNNLKSQVSLLESNPYEIFHIKLASASSIYIYLAVAYFHAKKHNIGLIQIRQLSRKTVLLRGRF